jgi:hypothetical protein
MDCICAVGQVTAGGRIVSSKKQLCHEIAMEVCLVGRNSETPVILSQTVPLTAARRRSSSSSHRQQKNTLDVIPEAEELGKRSSSRSCLMMIDQPRLVSAISLSLSLSLCVCLRPNPKRSFCTNSLQEGKLWLMLLLGFLCPAENRWQSIHGLQWQRWWSWRTRL